MSHFIIADRKTNFLLPASVEDWLGEDHLARFVVEVIDQLDLSNLTRKYAGRGSKAHHPATLLAILVYGYATGVFSSRKLETATYDSVAFRFIAANTHPDHDTLATFRRRFLNELAGLFVQVLEMAQEMKLLKLGTVCLDGTKIHANASRHSALSHGHIVKLQTQIELEVQELLALAEQADSANIPDGMNLPEELKLRKDRLDAMARPRPRLLRGRPCVMPRSGRSLTPSWTSVQPKRKKQARSLQAGHHRHLRLAYATPTRSISRTRSRASCRFRAVALSKPTTHRCR